MDDPTKDTIPRSAVEYCLRKETVSTNPEKYKTHEKFIDYMNDPDISEFGHWMHANGYNCALVSVAVDLEKIPSVTLSAQSGWIPCSERMPEEPFGCIVTVWDTNPLTMDDFENVLPYFVGWDGEQWNDGDGERCPFEVIAWKAVGEPYRLERGQE